MPRANPFLTHEEETYFRHFNRAPSVVKLPPVQTIEIKIVDEDPKWYQVLSNEQIAAADQLFEAIRIDCEENSIVRTKTLLTRIGLQPLVCDQVLSTLVCLSRGSDVAFLWLLFDLVYNTNCTYSLNERILLSSLCHLDMAVTLLALNRNLPLPEMAYRQISKSRMFVAQRNYISPYLEPNPVPRKPKQKSSFTSSESLSKHSEMGRYSSAKNGGANRWLSIKADEVAKGEMTEAECEEESENNEEQSETKDDCEEWPRFLRESEQLRRTKPHRSLYEECREVPEQSGKHPQNVMPTFEGTIGSCLQTLCEDDCTVTEESEPEECAIDPCDHQQMRWLLKKGLKTIGEENEMLIVPFLPEAHKIPILREWIRARYGYRHTPDTRKDTLTKSRRQWNALNAKERRSVVATPRVKDVHCKCVADWDLKKRLTGRAHVHLANYYRDLAHKKIEANNKLWQTLAPFECPRDFRSTFYAYLPDHEKAVHPVRPWQTHEFRENFKKDGN